MLSSFAGMVDGPRLWPRFTSTNPLAVLDGGSFWPSADLPLSERDVRSWHQSGPTASRNSMSASAPKRTFQRVEPDS
jgi:hypothetical protein